MHEIVSRTPCISVNGFLPFKKDENNPIFGFLKNNNGKSD
jgi:hypothetical protein